MNSDNLTHVHAHVHTHQWGFSCRPNWHLQTSPINQHKYYNLWSAEVNKFNNLCGKKGAVKNPDVSLHWALELDRRQWGAQQQTPWGWVQAWERPPVGRRTPRCGTDWETGNMLSNISLRAGIGVSTGEDADSPVWAAPRRSHDRADARLQRGLRPLSHYVHTATRHTERDTMRPPLRRYHKYESIFNLCKK